MNLLWNAQHIFLMSLCAKLWFGGGLSCMYLMRASSLFHSNCVLQSRSSVHLRKSIIIHFGVVGKWGKLAAMYPYSHFPDDIFKSIFFNENVQILIKISLTFVPKAPINNIPALVQIMAWRRPGDKPLSEPMMVSLLTHIRVTRPQWFNMRVIFRWWWR